MALLHDYDTVRVIWTWKYGQECENWPTAKLGGAAADVWLLTMTQPGLSSSSLTQLPEFQHFLATYLPDHSPGQLHYSTQYLDSHYSMPVYPISVCCFAELTQTELDSDRTLTWISIFLVVKFTDDRHHAVAQDMRNCSSHKSLILAEYHFTFYFKFTFLPASQIHQIIQKTRVKFSGPTWFIPLLLNC